MNSNKISRKKSEQITFPIIFVVFLLYAILMLLPVLYGINISLKENSTAFSKEPVRITFPLYFSNYIRAFSAITIEDQTYVSMLINSIWYSAGSTFMSLTACTCTAYVIAKYKFKGRNFIYSLALVVMMIPIYGALPSQYKLYSQLRIINSPLLLITHFGGFGMYFIYIHSFFKSLSWSYAEAAFIDGASNFRTFLTIMVPMMLPSISALAIMNFVGMWNDYANPIIFLPDMLPLASGMYTFEINMIYESDEPLYFAGVFISILPTVALFVIFQNTIMSNVYSGGLKG